MNTVPPTKKKRTSNAHLLLRGNSNSGEGGFRLIYLAEYTTSAADEETQVYLIEGSFLNFVRFYLFATLREIFFSRDVCSAKARRKAVKKNQQVLMAYSEI